VCSSDLVIEKFYSSFARLDMDGMAACYAESARFDDEAFSLQGRRQVVGMWRMLGDAARAQQAAGGPAWRLEYSGIAGQGRDGQAHWEAHYVFSDTGRRVHNIIDARFTFDDAGLILTHRDRFDFWRWSRQALGLPGWLLGWTPLLAPKIRARAAANLERYLAAHPEIV
jgi:hypothetical protein